MDLSILIPAYNEADRIRATLTAYADALRGRDAELIVVVNGSDDATEHIVRDEFQAGNPFIRMAVIPEKVGKGGALMRGLRESRGDRIAFTDADGSTPPTALLGLADAMDFEGVLIGSRWLPDSKIGRPQPLSRRVASRLFNGLVRVLFDLRITDTQCGAKVMTRGAVDAVLPRVGTTQWAFDVEWLFQIRRAGFELREVPVAWNDVSGSKVKLVRHSVEMTFALLRLRMLHSPFKPAVNLWDRTLGLKLYQRRMARLRATHLRL